MKLQSTVTVLVACLAVLAIGATAAADPLPGEVLKFQQLPLNVGLAPSVGGAPYPGHDEWSTAYELTPAGGGWQGTFMADDFADNFSTPVVHVRWWGSYDQNQTFNGVQRFLISFESDMPYDPMINASRPDQPLLNQIVKVGPLSQASGTFTEKLINGNVPEHLYEYNAELALPFNQQKDTVYWLKIVALVDPATEGLINWGWHNRDWLIKDPLASPNVSPGERDIGPVIDPNGTPLPVWHFQDDAVSGRVIVTPNAAGGVSIQQANYKPENYIYQIPGAVGIDGPFGIQNFSKDLAFELYTKPVPEPATLVLAGLGACGIGLWVRRRRQRQAV